MRLYVASRFVNIEKVKEIHGMAISKGWELAFDWTRFPKIDVAKKIATSSARSSTEIISIMNSHVFILVNCEGGCGMYVEMGAAIASCLKTGRPLVYVTGDQLDRSIFFYHPSVKVMPNVEDIFEDVENTWKY